MSLDNPDKQPAEVISRILYKFTSPNTPTKQIWNTSKNKWEDAESLAYGATKYEEWLDGKR